MRTAQWALGSGVRAGRRVAKAAMTGENPLALVDEAIVELRAVAREVLGVSDLEQRLGDAIPGRGRSQDSEPAAPSEPLRDHGAELLRRSADVEESEEIHPAYELILGSLAPDEARVLRLLATEGAQAAVDVRTWRPLGIGSELVAPGLSMIGAEAGCRYTERVPPYLNNLFRLGLIWFSREPLGDVTRYQVLEAQPDAVAAMKKAGRGSTKRRSIHLTPFGEDFCDACLPLDTADRGRRDRRHPGGERRDRRPGRDGRPRRGGRAA